jgi:hypothetical protein
MDRDDNSQMKQEQDEQEQLKKLEMDSEFSVWRELYDRETFDKHAEEAGYNNGLYDDFVAERFYSYKERS